MQADTEILLSQLKREKQLLSQNSGNSSTNQLSKLQSQTANLEEQLTNQKKENDRLREELDTIKSENEELRKQVRELMKSREKMQEETSEAFSEQFMTFHNEVVTKIRAEKNEELENKIKDLR